MLSSITLVMKEFGRVGWDRIRPDGDSLPNDGEALTAAFIERAMGRPPGSVRSVTVVDEHHGTAGRVRIRVTSSEGADVPDALFVKTAPHNLVQRLMMNVFDLGRREVLFYSAVVQDVPIRVPRCHAAEFDHRRGRNVMLLEDLSDSARFRDIREPASVDEAGAVVDALADLHAAFWESPRLSGDLAPLRRRRPEAERIGNMFVGRVLGSLKGSSAEIIPPAVQRASRMAFERRAEIDALWSSQPQALCHGDPHLGNLFFEGARPGFLDWQAVMVSPGIRDVSYFLVTSVDVDVLEEHERRLVDRYVERLRSRHVEVDPQWAWQMYRATAVECYVAAVVTAGTSDRMQPPEISRVGVGRVNRAVQRLDTFEVLGGLLDEAEAG